MRQITEVLRLNTQGLSYRQIAQSIGISASTVQSYLERAQRAGLSWPLADEMDDAAIEARLFTRTEEELRPGRPEPDWLEVHRQRKRGKHVTLQLLHLEYKALHPEGLSYTQFCVHYRRWRARQDVVMRLEYAAGERMFVDFAATRFRSPTPRRVRSGTRRCLYACLAPAATCTSRRPAARTWHRGSARIRGQLSSTAARHARSCPIMCRGT